MKISPFLLRPHLEPTPQRHKLGRDPEPVARTTLSELLGCVIKSDMGHLHAEAKIMPVKDHCEMLSQQFLLAGPP